MDVARQSGRRIVDMVKEGLRPRDIITRKSIENAVRLGMAIGGSTNLIMHILAIAHEAKVPFTIDDYEKLSRTTPQIARLMTASQYDMVDFYEAGAVPAVMHEILPLLHGDALTVTGKTMEENLKDAASCVRRSSIRWKTRSAPTEDWLLSKAIWRPFPASANPQPSP